MEITDALAFARRRRNGVLVTQTTAWWPAPPRLLALFPGA